MYALLQPPNAGFGAAWPVGQPSALPLVGAARPGGQLLGTPPQTVLKPFHSPRTTLESMTRAALGPAGEQSMLVRQFTEWVVRGVFPKDYLGEVLAVRNSLVQMSPWLPGVPLFRYTNDPRHVEMVKTPERMVREIREHGTTLADCDDMACMAGTMCLLLGREVEFVALGFAPNSLSHVATRVREPKSNAWIWMDGVAGPRERDAAARAREVLEWSLD